MQLTKQLAFLLLGVSSVSAASEAEILKKFDELAENESNKAATILTEARKGVLTAALTKKTAILAEEEKALSDIMAFFETKKKWADIKDSIKDVAVTMYLDRDSSFKSFFQKTDGLGKQLLTIDDGDSQTWARAVDNNEPVFVIKKITNAPTSDYETTNEAYVAFMITVDTTQVGSYGLSGYPLAAITFMNPAFLNKTLSLTDFSNLCKTFSKFLVATEVSPTSHVVSAKLKENTPLTLVTPPHSSMSSSPVLTRFISGGLGMFLSHLQKMNEESTTSQQSYIEHFISVLNTLSIYETQFPGTKSFLDAWGYTESNTDEHANHAIDFVSITTFINQDSFSDCHPQLLTSMSPHLAQRYINWCKEYLTPNASTPFAPSTLRSIIGTLTKHNKHTTFD